MSAPDGGLTASVAGTALRAQFTIGRASGDRPGSQGRYLYVGIEAGLARNRASASAESSILAMRANPARFAPDSSFAGPGDVEGDAAVQPIDDDIDRAGLSRAAPAQDRVGAFDFRSPEVGGDPYVGAQPQAVSGPVEELAAD